MIETLGQYKILDRIGIGRTGSVYRARDMRAGRTVAIRVVADEIVNDPQSREGFLRAARATAALSHPSLATLYEIGEDQGYLFLVFEYVPGKTLAALISDRALNTRHALDVAIQLADALAVAHADAVIHGGIHPGNIVETPKGHAKFLDFGLSVPISRLEDGQQVTVTGAGARPHDVAYASPELLLGGSVDHRTDIYSLGAVLFEMLTGKPPFTGATTNELAKQILETPATSPSGMAARLPPALDTILRKMLAKNANERYEVAATPAAELRSVVAALDAESAAAVNVRAPRHHESRVAVKADRLGGAFWIAIGLGVFVVVMLVAMASDAGRRWLSSLIPLW
jgi:serine/threonine-protein kinase